MFFISLWVYLPAMIILVFTLLLYAVMRTRPPAFVRVISHGRRRALFGFAALPALAFLAACTTRTVNGVTTVTLNLASINAWATAIKNGVALITGNPVLSTLLGSAKVAIIQAAVTDLGAAVSALNTAYNGKVSVVFTTTSVPAAVTAFEADCSTILGTVNVLAGSLGSSVSASVVSGIEALQTIAAIGAAVVGTGAGTVSAPYTPMTEAQALAVLGVHAS